MQIKQSNKVFKVINNQSIYNILKILMDFNHRLK